MNKRTKIGLAGLALLGATSVLSPNVNAQDKKPVEDNSGKTTTITVPSQRNYAGDGKCYEGVPFTYDVLDFYARRTDENQTKFLPRFFYDIDNDGKFGAMEEAMQKAGIPVYMSDDFTQKFLEAYRKQDKEKLMQLTDDYERRLNELEKRILELSNQIPKEIPEVFEIRKSSQDYPLPLPEAPEAQCSETPIKQKKERGYALVSLIAQGNTNSAFDSFGASIGARVGNETIGLGALLDFGLGFDKLVDSYSGPLSAERTAYGTVTDTNKLSIGGSLELKIGPCIFGAGADYSNWLRTTIEQIRDKYGNVIKSNTNSTPNRQAFAKGYAGFEFGSDDLKARITTGYHERDGFYFGAGTAIKLNQPKKGK